MIGMPGLWEQDDPYNNRCKTCEAGNSGHRGNVLQPFLFGHTTHPSDHPESTVIHPANRFRTAADGQSHVERIDPRVPRGDKTRKNAR